MCRFWLASTHRFHTRELQLRGAHPGDTRRLRRAAEYPENTGSAQGYTSIFRRFVQAYKTTDSPDFPHTHVSSLLHSGDPMTATNDIPEEEIEKIVQTSWEILLGNDLARVEVPFGPAEEQDPQFAGVSAMTCESYSLLLVATAGRSLARSIASGFFHEPVDEVTPGEIREAMAELVNVFTGNAGALVPESLSVTTPMTIAGADLRPLYGDRPCIHQGVYTTGSDLLEVRVHRAGPLDEQ